MLQKILPEKLVSDILSLQLDFVINTKKRPTIRYLTTKLVYDPRLAAFFGFILLLSISVVR